MKKKIAVVIIAISIAFIFYTFRNSNPQYKEYILAENNGNDIKIPISSIPELEDYLKDYSKEEREIEINRIITRVLDLPDDCVYIDLRYSCGAKLCNHVLIKIFDKKTKSMFLSDSSILKDYKASPNKENLMFIFQINEGVEVYRNIVKVVSLKDLTEIASKEIKSYGLNQYIWPFKSYGWSDDQHIFIEIPNIQASEYSDLKKWLHESNRESIKIDIDM